MMKRLFTFLLMCHIGSSGIPDLPDFVASAVVDGVEVGYCDNILNDVKPRTPWITGSKLFQDHPQHLQWLNSKCLLNYYDFKATIVTLKQRFNQSEGVHIFQRKNGCFWNNETGEFDAFNEYGYDGEDLIRFDLKTMTWITPRHQTVITKHNWDSDGTSLFWKYALTEECRQFLQLYLKYGKIALQTTVHPSATLLQKTTSAVVTCHATGFYPERALMFWRKDGAELHEGVEKGEILPNNDGTFQMAVYLNVSLINDEDWNRYDCLFQFSSNKDNVTTILDRAIIKTNQGLSFGMYLQTSTVLFCCFLSWSVQLF
ncbi:PREDICTED: major histocompatibility complex class I-related gene protein-like isoform X2 [Cyprinodon variegatus]|uniref:major histocompatibility complex class I-related gene protein-like isoform X2 n=1 Tax=Cyprinodon variegatus TaxID=28743 RepID=UPI0007427BFF|nr:PREDICTED: major histocompatibility complex class I-related gene protein-like isoform X2 [Cyprinodon variegatus]